MSLDKIVAGDYGQVIELTFIDVDTEEAADISGYDSAQEMLFTSPSGQTVAKTAAFGTDGTDGVIEYTVDEDFLTAGHWKLRGRVSSATAVLTTVVHSFEVIG